jgi:hypothetical protein
MCFLVGTTSPKGDGMEPRDPTAAAAERADAATRRAREIADRLTRLAVRKRTDRDDVREAQEADTHEAELDRQRAARARVPREDSARQP